MKWPWRRKQENPEYKAALFCLIAAEKIVGKLAGSEGPNVSGRGYWTSLTETVCCALHLIDRTLFDSVPDLRQARMDAILTECLKLLPEGMYEFSDLSQEEVDSAARELLLSLYDERMNEYSAFGEDWLKKVLFRYGQNIAENLFEGEFRYEVTMKAQMEMTSLYSGLIKFVPELFK